MRAMPSASKPPAPESVTLRPVTQENWRTIGALEVRADQQRFVARNVASMAEASFFEHAWYRAIYAGDVPVGFVMLHDDPNKGEYYVWRFMIDALHQHKGYGRAALERIVAHVRTRPKARELFLSYVPGEGSPGDFYRAFGFEETGKLDDGELVMRLVL